MAMKHKRTVSFPYRERTYLHIDLTDETSTVITLSEEISKTYLGGRSLALALWNEYAQYDKLDDKLYEAGNPVVLSPGSAVDTPMVCCNSFSLVTKNPVTERLGVYSTASPFAKAILGCGFSAIVITGRSRKLCSLSISSQGAIVDSAEQYYDVTTTELARQLKEPHLLAIGPAGEHKVSHASVVVNSQNFGRGGVGVVFGLKNLKFLTISPTLSGRECYDSYRLGKLATRFLSACKKPGFAHSFSQNGPVALLERANKHGWAAIDTYRMRVDGRLWGLMQQGKENTSGEVCPVCSASNPPADLQCLLALGANLEIFDSRSVAQLEQRCLENGLDCLSAGSTLAWARKLRQQGKLSFIPDLGGSSPVVYLRLLDAMAYRKGTGEALGKSLTELVTEYGGKEFAYHVGALPLAPFDYRALPIQALLVSIGDDTLSIPELLWGNVHQRGNERKLARWAIYLQDLRFSMESLGLCFWTTTAFFAHPFFRFPWFRLPRRTFNLLAHAATYCEGYPLKESELRRFGRTAWKLQHEIDLKLGANPKRGSLPDQLLVEGKSNYKHDQVVPLARLLDAYWSLRKVQ